MDQKTERPPEADIPVLPGAKKDDERRRRGGALPWFPQAVGQGGLFGYTAAGVIGSKFGLLAIIGALIAGSAALGTHLRHQMEADQKARASRKVARAFAQHSPAGTVGAPENVTSPRAGDGMSYVSGSLGTAGPGAGGDKGAESGDASKDGKGAEGGKGAADGNAPPVTDPAAAAAALAAQAAGQAGQGALQGNKFGQLSSGLGGSNGLAGGAGLAGGINRGFGQQQLDNQLLAKTSAFSQGSKASVQKRPMSGSLGKNTMRGGSARRLMGINNVSTANQGQSAQTQSAANTAAWESAQAGGQGIQGAGAGTASNAITGMPDTAVAGGEGGPTLGNSPTATDTTPPDVGDTENITPYQSMVDLAKMMLMLAGLLSAIAWILGVWGQHLLKIAVAMPPDPVGGTAKATAMAHAISLINMAHYFAYAAAASGAIAALMGVAIMAFGQMMQGMMFTTLGALAAVMAFMMAKGLGSTAQLAQEALKKGAEEAAKQILTEMAKHSIFNVFSFLTTPK